MESNSIIERLIGAADNHGEDSEPDHTVGDLQGLLRRSWGLMTREQREILLKSDEVEQLVEMGGRGEFDVEDLLEDLPNEQEPDCRGEALT